jgi:radical SAM protein with 4Fe4S-binding SPASM domain
MDMVRCLFLPKLPGSAWHLRIHTTAGTGRVAKRYSQGTQDYSLFLLSMPEFNWNDSINLLSKFTPRKAWNAAKVLSSYYVSKISRKPVQWGYPISISFEPTTSCNLRCPECPSGLRAFTRPIGMLKKDFFSETIDQLSAELLYLVFYFQGEPYLNPSFLDMVRYASSKGIYTATSTNAHYLNDENARKTVESGLDRLIISIDGTTQDVYQQYRVGGKLEKVLEGARNIVKWKKELKSKTPFVFFQFLVVKPNEHQIEDIKKLAKETGVDEVRFKTAQVYDYENDPNGLIPTTDKYSRYKKNEKGEFQFKNSLQNHCWRLWHATVISWDGLVVPCCFDKDAQHKLGDLKGKPFKDIWHNEAYVHFRKSLLSGRKNIDICANCSEGTKVWG